MGIKEKIRLICLISVLGIIIITGCTNPVQDISEYNSSQSRSVSTGEFVALAEEFAPILYFHPDEKYFLSSTDWFLERVQLRNSKGETFFPASDYIPVSDPSLTYDLPIVNEDTKAGNLENAEIYANIKTTVGEDYVDIQYWFFSPYNGGGHITDYANYFLAFIPELIANEYGHHEGDWEHITVRVNRDSKEIMSVYFSQHGSGEWLSDVNKLERKGNQIYVYSSLDGHASFYSGGEHIYMGALANKCGKGRQFDSFGKVKIMGIDGELTPDYQKLYEVKNWGNDGPAAAYRKGSWTGVETGGEIRAIKYDTGTVPSAVFSQDGKIVDIHSDSGNNNLYYNVGSLKLDNTIDWHRIGVKYDTGNNPSLLVAPDGRLIDIHNGGTNGLYYSVGSLNFDNSISWHKKGVKYDTGNRPTTAISPDNRIIEIHNGGNWWFNNNLYYSIGKLNSDNSISWLRIGSKYDTGDDPSIAFHPNGEIIEIHNGGTNNNLYYSVGTVNSNNTISWHQKGVKYDTGYLPTLEITDDGLIIDIHNGGTNNLYYSLGILNPDNTINWFRKGIRYDDGSHPTTAYQDGKLVEIHNGGTNNNLYYNTMIQYFF